MASKSKRARTVKQRNLAKDFMYWAIAVFIIKLIIISNVQGGAWLGADGENYIKGANALASEGFFSKEPFLSYWPAGYPLFMYILNSINANWTLYSLSIIQSAVYSFAVFFFSKQLLNTRIKSYAYITSIILLLNPTLSLSSIAIGYESLVASGLLLITGLYIQNSSKARGKIISKELFTASIILFFVCIFQPRFLLSAFILFIIWTFYYYGKRLFFIPLIISLAIVAVSPSILIFRNERAMGFAAISTNLGGTMNLGAGDKASGAYTFKDSGVPCSEISGNAAEKDQHLTKCVIKWYLTNPIKAVKLAYNKSKFFWSPWYGPEANGSMARNPWLLINPIKNISENSPDGMKLVFGNFGRVMSYIWMISQILFLFYGYKVLAKMGKIEFVLANFVLINILLSWLISIGTLGDHRQRLPIMGMSLFLQCVGLRKALKGRKA